MESVLKPIANKFHIYFGVNKGYSSASTMYDLAQRIKDKIFERKRVVILYLGDHDPSGLDMIRDIRERIEEFLTQGDDPVSLEACNDDLEPILDENGDICPSFEVIPLALNMTQIRQYNPPPNPAKITDPRAGWYIGRYGEKSWELDALEPKILMDITQQGVLRYLDVDKYNAWIEKEKNQIKALESFGDSLVNEEDKKDGEE
jgi:hypothetical protein